MATVFYIGYRVWLNLSPQQQEGLLHSVTSTFDGAADKITPMVEELIEKSGSTTGSTPTSNLPDLTIQSAWLDRPNSPYVRSGTIVLFGVSVLNRGNATAHGTMLVVGTGNSSGQVLGPLSPGESKTATIPIEIYGSTTIRPTFRVNPSETIRESDFSNNTYRSPVAVRSHG